MDADIEAVLFDLDGTLVDTAPDMAHVLNLVCREHEKPAVPYARVRAQVSNGVNALLHLAFAELDDSQLEVLRQRYLEIYADNLARFSTLFDGMGAVLDLLDAHRLRWGVVTNKPSAYTEPLLHELGIAERAACVVSGDSAPRAKPHPDPLLLASRTIGIPAVACLYLGDAQRDVVAARAAGMQAVVASYGYLETDCRPDSWNPDAVIRHPGELTIHLALAGT